MPDHDKPLHDHPASDLSQDWAGIMGAAWRRLPPLRPGLHIVATPIGNLADITLRALHTLSHADVLVAEDTRITSRLLQHYGLKKPMLTYQEHNAQSMRPRLLDALKKGQTLALVSDAGTPLIADPGYKLVREALQEGIHVEAYPGPCAIIQSLVLAGLPTDHFTFHGFLPAGKGAREKTLAALLTQKETHVMYEAPSRIVSTLEMLATMAPHRPMALARELTKHFEEVLRGTALQVWTQAQTHQHLKGEMVLVVGGANDHDANPSTDIEAALQEALQQHSLKEAVALVTAATHRPRKEVYAQALLLQKRNEG
jgi:16S rRNA (cytidine1402-2'-O)-methyltransferase